MKKPDTYTYPAIFTYSDDVRISVIFPDLDAATQGENDADALRMSREYLGITLNGLEEDHEEIPAPTPLSRIETNPNQRTVLIDVYMPSIRLREANRAVKRTVTLPAWLNALAMEKHVNFSGVLQEALKEKLGTDGPLS